MTALPCRIQRKRTKGWKLPPNTRCVSRGTAYGNGFRVGVDGDAETCLRLYAEEFAPYRHHGPNATLDAFYISEANIDAAKAALGGCNLACWCKLCPKHQNGLPVGIKCPDCAPCHADFLLGVANLW